MATSSKLWQTADVDTVRVAALSAATGLPVPIAGLLMARGHGTAEAVDNFLHPRLSRLSDPFALPGIAAACDRIWQAIDAGQPITIYGDYDVDGVTSAGLLCRVLGGLGAKVTPFLPDRETEGYGFTVPALQRCLAASSPTLIITVDCGSSSVEAVEAARAAGVDVVVTDHHEISTLAAPVALVNPKADARTRHLGLAGVGVAFKLCHALLKGGRAAGRTSPDGIDLREYLDLVAVGTIADMVPLTDENRTLAAHGLARLEQSPCVGLQALREVAGANGSMDSYHVGFVLGPRLNAAGRLGSALAALELVTTRDGVRARVLAQELDDSNRQRQGIEQRMVGEAMAEIDAHFDPARHFGIVVGRQGWHKGVIGIVASRVVARWRRPTVVIAFDDQGVGRGSCRSIDGFNLLEALDACGEYLEAHGGHAMAAGLTVAQEHFGAFQRAFDAVCRARLADRDLRPVVRIDGWLAYDQADERLMAGIDRLRPFGTGHVRPVWGLRALRVVGPPRLVGKSHLKLLLAGGGTQWDAIGFGMADRDVPEGPVDVVFNLQRNSYQGRESLQLNVQDFRPSES